MTTALDRLLSLHQSALGVRTERGQVLASNIANADTPGYQARDLDFRAALAAAIDTGSTRTAGMVRTSSRHLAGDPALSAQGSARDLLYRTVTQASADNNTVDLNVERAQFADNAMRYEASLVFLNGKIKTMLAAIQT